MERFYETPAGQSIVMKMFDAQEFESYIAERVRQAGKK